MSDLHRLSNEFNKHTPKGFDLASNNTKLLRDERGQSRYVDNTNIGVFIDFADPTLPPPSTVNGDVYILIGAGTVDTDWGFSAENDIVIFGADSLPVSITPNVGYFAYNLADDKHYKFDGAWVEMGGSTVEIYNGTDVTPLTQRKKIRFTDFLGAVDDAIEEETVVSLDTNITKDVNTSRFGLNLSDEVDLKIPHERLTVGDVNGNATNLTGTEGNLIGFKEDNKITEFEGIEAFNILKETGITANKQLALIGIDGVASNLKATFIIDEILVINTTANSVVISVGSTAGGIDIANAITIGASATVVLTLGTRYFSSTSGQNLFISSALWNSANVTISVTVKKIHYV